MQLATAIAGIGVNGVGQSRSSQEKEQHQHRREADAADEGVDRVKRADRSVHVCIDESGGNENGDV